MYTNMRLSTIILTFEHLLGIAIILFQEISVQCVSQDFYSPSLVQ